MKSDQKEQLKRQLLDRLTKNFTISSACRAIGIDRKTFYRWVDEDTEFKRKAYENVQECKKDITDLANTRLVKHIDHGNLTAIMFWLNNKDPEITDKAVYLTDEEVKELSTLLYNENTFKKGQEQLTSYVLRGKVSEKVAVIILRLFMAQLKAEDVLTRKVEADLMAEVMLRKKRSDLRRK